MLDSSMALMLLVLLGVIILVILAVIFLYKIGNITNGVQKNLNEIDKSICRLESKIDTSKYVDTVAKRVEATVEASIKEVGNAHSELKERQSVSNDKIPPVSEDNLVKGTEHSREVEAFWENLEREKPDSKQVGVDSNIRSDRNQFGFIPKDKTIAVDITEIREEPVHSIDAVMAGMQSKPAGNFSELNFANTAEPSANRGLGTRNDERKLHGLDAIISANNKPQNKERELSFAERLKQETIRLREEEFSKRESAKQVAGVQPAAQEKVIRSIDAVRRQSVNSGANRAVPHFVDRESGIDRQGRVYSVEQLKEQIK